MMIQGIALIQMLQLSLQLAILTQRMINETSQVRGGRVNPLLGLHFLFHNRIHLVDLGFDFGISRSSCSYVNRLQCGVRVFHFCFDVRHHAWDIIRENIMGGG